MAKLLGEELEETSESYWRAAQRCYDAGFRQEFFELRDHARELKFRELLRKVAGVVAALLALGLAIKHFT